MENLWKPPSKDLRIDALILLHCWDISQDEAIHIVKDQCTKKLRRSPIALTVWLVCSYSTHSTYQRKSPSSVIFNAELLAQFSAGSRSCVLTESQDAVCASPDDTKGVSLEWVLSGRGRAAEWWCHNSGVPHPQEQRGCHHPSGSNPCAAAAGQCGSCLLWVSACGWQSCPAGVGRCHLPWRNMLLSQKQEHNYVWKHFIFSLSFIILPVHVTVTHALFLLPRAGSCRSNTILGLLHGLSIWGLVVEVRFGSSKDFFSTKHYFAMRGWINAFFFSPKECGFGEMQMQQMQRQWSQLSETEKASKWKRSY